MTGELWPMDRSPRRDVKPSGAGAIDGETRERLLDATDQLARQFGFAKISMADVARSAGVARATLYRYFESREVLFDALVQRTADRFFADAGAAMRRLPKLAEQMGEFSEMMSSSIHPDSGRDLGNQAAMVRMLATQSVQALRRTSAFLAPYIEAARERGEVRANLDVGDASEWLARVLLSFTIFHASVAYEADDPRSVSQFVQRYAIGGLAAE
jgi:AcrR family transcriptional regulator